MITSERNVYIAAHVTQMVKDYLRQQAMASGKSVSALISEVLTEKMEGTNGPEQASSETGQESPATQH